MAERTRSGAIDPSFSVRGRGGVSGRPVVARRMVRGKPVDVYRPASAAPAAQLSPADVKKPRTVKRQAQHHKPAMPRHSRSTVLSRQVVAAKKANNKKRPKEKIQMMRKLSLKNIGLAVLAVLFVGLSGWTMHTQQWRLIGGVKGDSTAGNSSVTSVTDEAPVTIESIKAYAVESDLPRTIKINKLQLYARTAHLPPVTSSRVEPPVNISDAGWHTESSKPGEAGAMVLSGHVHAKGSNDPGIFNRLGNLSEGDVITVENGGGETFDYEVVKTVIYENDKVDMDALKAPVEAGKPGLNLLSHTTRYDVEAGKFEKRLVVFASLK